MTDRDPSRAAAPSCATGDRRDRVEDVVLLDASLSRGTFPLWPVNRLFANFAGVGGQLEQVLRAAGIDPGKAATSHEEIAGTDLVRLLRRTIRLGNDELWGLRPQPTRPGTFAQACRIAVHAITVEAALRAAFRFYHGVVDDFTLRLVHDADRSLITVVDRLPDRPGRDILHTLILQGLRTAIEWLSGRAGFVRRIDFAFAPPQAETLAATFGVGFSGNAPRTRLVVDRQVLAHVVVASESDVRAFVASMPGKLARVVQDRRTVADRAAGLLRAQGDWAIGRDTVAAALNMSGATFARRLHEEIGGGFQDLKDRLRCAAAIDLMAVQGVNLDQVARTLGFAELSSFHRAFKRWTGESPGTYRGAQQPR